MWIYFWLILHEIFLHNGRLLFHTNTYAWALPFFFICNICNYYSTKKILTILDWTSKDSSIVTRNSIDRDTYWLYDFSWGKASADVLKSIYYIFANLGDTNYRFNISSKWSISILLRICHDEQKGWLSVVPLHLFCKLSTTDTRI